MTKERYARVQARLAHTEKHVRTALKEIADWQTMSNVVGTAEMLPGKLGYQLRATGLREDILTDLGFTVGQCFYDLRAILDNLGVSLAYLNADPPAAPKKLYWPIHLTEAEFAKNAGRVLEQMSPEVASAIEEVQPFQRKGRPGEGLPKDDPAVLLHAINIDDKHYTPVAVTLLFEEVNFNAGAEFETEEGAALSVPPAIEITLPLREGEVFMRWDTKGPLRSAAGTFIMKGHLVLSFDDKQVPLAQTLENLTNYVRLVVYRFSPFFV